MKKDKSELKQYNDFRKYTIEEIADMLVVGKTKATEMLQKRILPVTKIGKDYFTSATAIQDFLVSNIGKELKF